MPSFLRTTAGGKAISGGALQPRGRRGSTAQVASYWAGGLVDDTAFESIATTTVGGTAESTITFSSIPSTYKHLQLRILARSNNTGVDDIFVVRFNSDSGANYSRHFLLGNGSAVSSFGLGSETYILADGSSGATTTANIFGSCVMDIADYANTNKFKTLRSSGGVVASSTGYLTFISGNWRSTSAITSITITSYYSGSWVQYSSFALYGIKG
jgi:hypothetical protein